MIIFMFILSFWSMYKRYVTPCRYPCKCNKGTICSTKTALNTLLNFTTIYACVYMYGCYIDMVYTSFFIVCYFLLHDLIVISNYDILMKTHTYTHTYVHISIYI